MARVTLILPEKKIFQTELTISVADINYGGHLGNDRVLALMHEARLRFIKSLGYKDEVSIAKDIALFVVDSVVVYKAEAFHGDSISISLAMEDFNAYGMDIFYKLENTETGQEVARGKTGTIFFNLANRKVSKIPEKFLDQIEAISAS